MQKPIRGLLILAVAGLAAYTVRAAAPTLTGIDLGTPTNPGSVTTGADGKITIVGGGADIWNAADAGFYAYYKVTGDFDYVAKVESLVGNTGDGGWSKIELMARIEEFDGAGPQAPDPFIANMTTRPSSDTPTTGSAATGAAGVNYRGPQWRVNRGGSADWRTPAPVITPNMPNNWVRLERVGTVLYMYWSNDGKAWSMYNPYSPQGFDTAGMYPAGADNATAFPGYNITGGSASDNAPWTNTVFLGLAVTAHSDPDITTAVVDYFGPYTNGSPVAIVTQPPAAVSVVASQTLKLSVVTTGDPVHYQWRKNGVAISTNALGSTYTLYPVVTSDAGTYSVRVYGTGKEVISSDAVVTVTVDTVPPTLVRAHADGSFTAVTVQFSEPVGPSATNAANYSISPSVAVTSVAVVDLNTVKLTTATQAKNTQYTLTINNVKDLSGNTIAANTTTTFQSASLLKGYAFYERWMDANGDLGDINAFAAAILASYSDPTSLRAPDVAYAVKQFEAPWGVADNYNSRVRAYFTPPSNGNYVFFVASDDYSNVYLSTDDNPANKLLICQEVGWSNQYQFTAPGTGDAASKRSDQCTATEWGNTITLQAGKMYYLEVLQNEGTGGDGADVTFIKEGDAVPTNVAADMHLNGDVISWYESTDNLPPSIATQPADNITIPGGGTATLSVAATGPLLTYQWQLNGKDIPGATSTNLVIANAGLAQTGQYTVIVSNPNGSVTSNPPTEVLVTVTSAFNIEAEDFDYDGGKTLDAASVMPYKGGAYAALSAKLNIDYHNDDNLTDSSTGTPVHGIYRYAAAANSDLESTNVAQSVNMADNLGGQWGKTRGGVWDMTANYKIGWINSGDWGNYTRTFPAGTYEVFAAQSYGTTGASLETGSISLVTAGVGTTNQTLQAVGSFDCPGSSAWSRNALVRMTDSSGAPKTVDLSGKQTVRWAYNSGDADYLLFIPTGPVVEKPTLSASVATDGKVTLTYTGTLVSSDTVNGTYSDVAGAASPFTFDPKTGAKAATFYQTKK